MHFVHVVCVPVPYLMLPSVFTAVRRVMSLLCLPHFRWGTNHSGRPSTLIGIISAVGVERSSAAAPEVRSSLQNTADAVVVCVCECVIVFLRLREDRSICHLCVDCVRLHVCLWIYLRQCVGRHTEDTTCCGHAVFVSMLYPGTCSASVKFSSLYTARAKAWSTCQCPCVRPCGEAVVTLVEMPWLVYLVCASAGFVRVVNNVHRSRARDLCNAPCVPVLGECGGVWGLYLGAGTSWRRSNLCGQCVLDGARRLG
jgi:hypothetical protein